MGTHWNGYKAQSVWQRVLLWANRSVDAMFFQRSDFALTSCAWTAVRLLQLSTQLLQAS